MNEEEMNEEKIIENQKQVEIENEKNINGTIDCMSLHINGKRTKEYLKFIKEVRKAKKKIEKKKERLAESRMLEQAYQKKEGKIDEYFKTMSEDYKALTQSKHTFRMVQFNDRNNNNAIADEIFMKKKFLPYMISESTQQRKYLDQLVLYSKGKNSIEDFRMVEETFNGTEMKAREEIIQKHYDSITAYVMGQVLCYYYTELDFWKSSLNKIEKINDIRDFE